MADPDELLDPTVDEVWTLVDKYALDRTFNNQDWTAARKEYGKSAGRDGGFKAAQKLVASLGDRYSRLLDDRVYSQMAKFDVIGAGVLIAPDDSGKQLVVNSPPMAGSSAEKRGVAKGDRVLEINGKSTKGMTAFDVIDLVMEDRSPTFRVTLQTPKEDSPREVELERSVAAIADPVQSKLLGDATGYLRIAEFNARSTSAVRDALTALRAQGATRFIVDVRGNPGGTFQTALSVAGAFLKDRPATYVVDAAGTRTEFKTTGDFVTADPLIVWTDRGSASASEVLTGALHDNCRALTVGDRTFGKGLVQGVFGLANGGGLALTVARYETPSGTDINGAGLQPDLEQRLPPRWLTSDMPEEAWDAARARLAEGPGASCPSQLGRR